MLSLCLCHCVTLFFHSLKPPKKHAIPPICNENTVCTPTILFASLLNVSDLIPPKNLLLIIYELMSMSKQYDFIFSSVGHKIIIYIYINLFHKCIKNNMEREKYEGTCFYLSGADCSIEKVSTLKLEFLFFFYSRTQEHFLHPNCYGSVPAVKLPLLILFSQQFL